MRPVSLSGAKLTNVLVLAVILFLWNPVSSPVAVVPGLGPDIAHAFTLNVVDENGGPITGYRWLVEEDVTFDVNPDLPPDPEPLTINFHKSHMPVIASGDDSTVGDLAGLDPSKRYFVSVLPYAGHSMGGAPVAAGQASVSVVCNSHPIPTAQISIFAFDDKQPLNNSPDLPQEGGLAGWRVILEEPAGRYGIPGGTVMQDAFGNPLGTTYNPDGTVDVMGDGNIYTDENGYALVQYLPPAKYGVLLVPPAGQDWYQTTTIEGSAVIDAWVGAGNGSSLIEFGVPSTHIFMGFVQPTFDTTVLTGGSAITGQVVNFHMARPPNVADVGLGANFINARVGLNDSSGNCVYAQPADPETGEFSILDVPPGLYQLVVWDEYLDIIIYFQQVNVPPGGGTVALGEVGVNDWFGHMWFWVFNDTDEDGMWDDGEMPMAEQNINLRFRDGTVYQAFPTDMEGFVPFDEVFPFFHWLVAEVDFLRYKPTGGMFVVDAGGPINPADPWSFDGVLNPQPQPDNGGLSYRVETGPVLTEAFQVFAGQTNAMMFGKTAYGPGENGGISGIVFYATTRAEDDPRYAAGEEWEPGIPRVQVNLYQDLNDDDDIDDINGVPGTQLADIDNYPFDWSAGGAMGPEDVERSGNDGVFDLGDAIQYTSTDSWDDNLPQDCPGDDPSDPLYLGARCYDGIRNWNQVRPGVFDGGYAFGPELDGGGYLPSGMYIVEAVPPPGYKTIKEEDKNVDFGDTYVPAALPPPCVGDDHLVPQYLSLQTDPSGNPLPGIDPADLIEAPYAGMVRPLCDRKKVSLTEGRNAAVDFWMFTQTPISARSVGAVTNDLGNEFDPLSPNFIEKFGAPFMPISFHDWMGNEVNRVYTDRWGKYNALLPSTWTVNIGSPSGVSPNMLSVCINSPIKVNPVTGEFTIDPHFRREFTQSCYTFQFMTGTTTYLDTPVLPISAFASRETYPLDCEFPSGTPLIAAVMGPEGGPYVSAADGTQQITITSLGPTQVQNPAFDPDLGNPSTILRDYGFGDTPGQVLVGSKALTNIVWAPDGRTITATVPSGTTTGQLTVIRGDNGAATPLGVTLTVGPIAGTVWHVTPPGNLLATPIQDAIDAASPGDLILVHPGLYSELVVFWKPVQLQGSGLRTTLVAAKLPFEKLDRWRDKILDLIDAGSIDLLPNQEAEFGQFPNVGLFPTEQGPGITVLAKNAPPAEGGFGQNPNARIDAFTITAADNGGAILVNGYADYLEISNNKVISNQGVFSGGIRIGHPVTQFAFNGEPVDAENDFVYIHHNDIRQNGATGEGGRAFGGGISVYTGSDGYRISNNHICGNFSIGGGAGIGHSGLSDNGLIAYNEILFNQSFHQTVNDASGGGITIQGIKQTGGGLTPGSGSVTMNSNKMLGNYAGAGDGGGVRLLRINGQDVETSPNDSANWHQIQMFNNIIVNNTAGLAGGGVSIQDAARVLMIHNTIANNDSTGTAGEAFGGGSAPGVSNPQPAGIVSRAHSKDLASVFGAGLEQTFSNPVMVNNIAWHNRSFYFDVTANDGFGGLIPDIGAGEPPTYDDLAVIGTETPQLLNPLFCVLTDTSGYSPTNLAADPLFVSGYENGNASFLIVEDRQTIPDAAAALDEGGNFIDIRFGPLSLVDPDTGLLFGDYHLQSGSPAINRGFWTRGVPTVLRRDVDVQVRPNGALPDMGADEFYP